MIVASVRLLTRLPRATQRSDPTAGLIGRFDECGSYAGRDVLRERRRAPPDDVHPEHLLGRAQAISDPELVPEPQQLAGACR